MFVPMCSIARIVYLRVVVMMMLNLIEGYYQTLYVILSGNCVLKLRLPLLSRSIFAIE